MLQLMRKHARNWLMKVILGIIIVVFVFYFGSTRGRQETETIAMLDGSRIVYADFRTEYQNLLDFYQQRYGEYLTDDLIKQINIKQQAFDSIVSQAIMLSEANELKLDISDNELQAAILSYPAFQKNGVFDPTLYQRTLQYQRMTPETFEATQRKAMKLAKIEHLIRESIKVSEREVYEIYKLQNIEITLDFIQIPVDSATVEENPSEEMLAAYLEKHAEEFRVPPMATIEYIYVTGKSFADTADISTDEIEDYYEYNKDEFTEGEETKPLAEVREEIIGKLSLVKGMDEAFEEAKTAHDTIYQEENFEAYAATLGLSIETADLARNIPPTGPLAGVQDDLATYVFSLQEGDLGRVFSDKEGYYVFRLVSMKPSRIPGLQEVVKEVRESYTRTTIAQASKARAEDILNRLRDGADMKKLAKEEGLEIAETGLFLPGPEIPKIGYSPDMETALFELSGEGPFPNRLFLVDGNYVIIKFQGKSMPDEEDWNAKKDTLKQDILKMKEELYIVAWMERIRETMISTGRLKILKEVEDL